MNEKQKRPWKLSKAKIKRITDRRIGNQAAYEQLVSNELCDDLAWEFAQRSKGSRIQYQLIASELTCVRRVSDGGKDCSLVMLLLDLYSTDKSLREFLKALDNTMSNYISARIDGEDYPLRIRGCVISEDLSRPLAKEYVRDRKALMAFLSAAFKRWRGICSPKSLWRVRLVTQQLAPRFGYDRKRILNHLQKIGAAPQNLTVGQTYSWRSRIGQYLSRDQKVAADKDFGFGLRPRSFGALLKAKSKKKSRKPKKKFR